MSVIETPAVQDSVSAEQSAPTVRQMHPRAGSIIDQYSIRSRRLALAGHKHLCRAPRQQHQAPQEQQR